MTPVGTPIGSPIGTPIPTNIPKAVPIAEVFSYTINLTNNTRLIGAGDRSISSVEVQMCKHKRKSYWKNVEKNGLNQKQELIGEPLCNYRYTEECGMTPRYYRKCSFDTATMIVVGDIVRL